MFIAPCIIQMNIAARKWQTALPSGEKIFGGHGL